MKLQPPPEFLGDPEVVRLYGRLNQLNQYVPPKPRWVNAAKWPFHPSPRIVELTLLHRPVEGRENWVAHATFDTGHYIASNRPLGGTQLPGYATVVDALTMLVQQAELVILDDQAGWVTERYPFYRARPSR